jgi:uridine kinase
MIFTLRGIVRDPVFAMGLALKLILCVLILPAAVERWYAPFMSVTATSWRLSPWGTWLDAGGTVLAFPYGYAMWLVFLPGSLLSRVLGIDAHWSYSVTLLIVDFLALLALLALTGGTPRRVTVFYWCSPIVIGATYVLGLNDLVPMLFLVLSILLLKRRHFLFAGAILAVAVSAKLSMLVVLPFFLIYLFHNKRLRKKIPYFGIGVGGIGTVLLATFFLNGAARRMLLDNPELSKVYALSLEAGADLRIYLAPLIYLAFMYLAWRIRRPNFALFEAMVGVGFLVVLLLTPAAPGWFIWLVPTLVVFQLRSDSAAIILVSVFSGLFLIGHVILGPYGLVSNHVAFSDGRAYAVVVSLLVAVGIILAIRLWRESVLQSDYFRLSRSPLVIGIAGDSASGKDTFCSSLSDLFGRESVATVSGDDYHLWDRQRPIWQALTHLNPMANDLAAYSNDVVGLRDGRDVQLRHYDHRTGQKSHVETVASNDIVLASGLHALYSPMLRDCYSLSIFLDMDESLRRFFKVHRDKVERGHAEDDVLSALTRREGDSAKYIRPQKDFADLILSLRPVRPEALIGGADPTGIRLKVVATSKNVLSDLRLVRVLVGVCGLHVDHSLSVISGATEMTIEGDAAPEDISLAAAMLCPRMVEFMDAEAQWRGGAEGILQLLTLVHLDHSLTKRLIR